MSEPVPKPGSARILITMELQAGPYTKIPVYVYHRDVAGMTFQHASERMDLKLLDEAAGELVEEVGYDLDSATCNFISSLQSALESIRQLVPDRYLKKG